MRFAGRKLVSAVVGALLCQGLGLVATGATTAAPAACRPRILVLSAFPGEIGMLLDEATVGADQPVTVRGRRFYVGRLRGHDVVLALTGIGLVNATETTATAIGHFRCDGAPGISNVVFSGVAGGGVDNQIGDVTIPDRWTVDGGSTWLHVDPAMLATASVVAGRGVRLTRRTPLGDLGCVCINPRAVKTVDLGRDPKVIVGGGGSSGDTFNGKRFPCVPFGGDTFGCEPCRDQGNVSLGDLRRLLGLTIFLDPEFILANIIPPPASSDTYVAVDMETAAAHAVAQSHGVPFLAFRAISDGHGDPAHLPGFPAQFFFYRQLAADNAALVTLSFLAAWG